LIPKFEYYLNKLIHQFTIPITYCFSGKKTVAASPKQNLLKGRNNNKFTKATDDTTVDESTHETVTGKTNFVSIQYIFWHQPNDTEDIQALLQSINVSSRKVAYDRHESFAVKSLRENNKFFKSLEESTCTSIVITNRFIKVTGFSEELIDQVEEKIRAKIEKKAIVPEEISLNRAQKLFLLNRRREAFEQMKDRFENVKFLVPENKSIIIIRGQRLKVAQAKESIMALISDVTEQQISFQEKINRRALNDLSELHDVIITPPEKNENKIKIIGTAANQEKVMPEIEKLKRKEKTFETTPEEYKKLVDILIHKKTPSKDEFQDTWNIKTYFDKPTQKIKVYYYDEKEAQDGMDALRALIKDHQTTKVEVELKDQWLYSFFRLAHQS